MKNKTKHIAVLMGGWNPEKEISTISGNAVYEALIKLGYKATKINFGRNIIDNLKKIKPDIIFNALHGTYGEDGKIQGLLDILNIPYTHSGVSASALCMDKVLARKICDSVGIKSPKFDLINKKDTKISQQKIIEKIGKPFVIKPINQGSSVGVEIILEDMNFDIEKYDWKYGDKIIIEKYITGQELNVAIVNDKAIGVIEVRPKTHLFYDYKSKYTKGMTDYIMPAEISEEKYQEVLNLGLKCHKALGCLSISRVEFILSNKDNQIYFLENNSQPGLTPLSLVPQAAKYLGISFEEIIEDLINSAQCNS